MNSTPNAFYLRSQIAFAILSGIPWAFIILLSFPIRRQNPELLVFATVYGLSTGLLVLKWIKYSKRSSGSIAIAVASCILWSIPVAASGFGVVLILKSAFDTTVHVANDIEFNPISFLWIPGLSLLWFCIPFLFSILYAWNSKRENTVEQGAPANPYPLRGQGLR